MNTDCSNSFIQTMYSFLVKPEIMKLEGIIIYCITCCYIYAIKIQIGPCVHSDWSKTQVLSEYKTQKKRVLLFCVCKIYILKQMKKPKPCHLRTIEKCISLVFSNDHRVLSQCNTRLRLLYLLNINLYQIKQPKLCITL